MRLKHLLGVILPFAYLFSSSSHADEVYYCTGELGVSVDDFQASEHNENLNFKFMLRNDFVEIKKKEAGLCATGNTRYKILSYISADKNTWIAKETDPAEWGFCFISFDEGELTLNTVHFSGASIAQYRCDKF